jgi:cbb3-type cytochrome oxidase cytochrome c subunit
MPATEETYRPTSNLHLWFAITSVGMLLATVWMIMADHLRSWKQVQREFQQVEDSKLKAAEHQRLVDLETKQRAALDEVQRKIKDAEAIRSQNYRKIRETRAEVEQQEGAVDRLDTEKRFKKAELDSLRSFYDGMIDRNEEDEAGRYLNTTIKPAEEQFLDVSKRYEAGVAKLDQLKGTLADLEGHMADLKKQEEAITRDYERAKRTREQKEQQTGEGGPVGAALAWFRGLPLLDMMASPVKIQQISLPDLLIDYNFKMVPRYDRCTTCHMGIDRLGYETDAEGKPMKRAFASHPHLADGATAIDPSGKVVSAGLYLDGNGPHKINSFGCTICHGGQGSGTDFTFASHTPNTVEQAKEWEKNHGWHEIHFWDEPMQPKRFQQAACLKCHYQVTDIPQADKLQAGYKRIVKYGCFGCHDIGGEGAIGPDLSDARQVGPNLAHIASKVTRDWTLKWIKNPHAFRPDTRMPKFYGLTNNDVAADWPKNHAEIYAITHYLFAKSTPPSGFTDPPAKGDASKGKDLFLQKGCLACHQHKAFDPSTIAERAGLGESIREYAKGAFGPNLSNVAAKFPKGENDQAAKWLANWILAPENYHSKSLMPNLQLSWQDAADLAAWLLSQPAEWPQEVEMPPIVSSSTDPQEVREEAAKVQAGLDELVTLFKSKTEPLSRVSEIVRKMTQDEKLLYVGEKTIGRMGCFGCHQIPGFENYKKIGTALNGWGFKNPARLDFAHINEFLDEKEDPLVDEYYGEKIRYHTRQGFLYEKLHRPRSYDYRKTKEDVKAWDERLRMPQFAWADDPTAIEEVMTFVLGLTGEKIPAKYLPQYGAQTAAIAQGERVINRYNCAGCHVLQMPRYTIAAPAPAPTTGGKLPPDNVEAALPDFATSVEVSYRNRANDYLALYPGLKFDEKGKPEVKGREDKEVVIEGMPIAAEDNILSVQLWQPVTIRGYTFNAGDNLTVDQKNVKITPPVGGHYAFLYASERANATGEDFTSIWNRVPPPLVREGKKVQTPWLTNFLQDPEMIRPAVNLRMPRFHFDKTAEETTELANFFAARDGADFPYQSIPQREGEYLARLEKEHPSYFTAGWESMTKGACKDCHAIGATKPSGGGQVLNGPDLRVVPDRFRPEYLTHWLSRPNRLLPYTAMPQNIAPGGPAPQFVPKTFEDKRAEQVLAIRDTLLNYVKAVEQQLAGGKPGTEPPKPAQASGGAE